MSGTVEEGKKALQKSRAYYDKVVAKKTSDAALAKLVKEAKAEKKAKEEPAPKPKKKRKAAADDEEWGPGEKATFDRNLSESNRMMMAHFAANPMEIVNVGAGSSSAAAAPKAKRPKRS